MYNKHATIEKGVPHPVLFCGEDGQDPGNLRPSSRFYAIKMVIVLPDVHTGIVLSCSTNT